MLTGQDCDCAAEYSEGMVANTTNHNFVPARVIAEVWEWQIKLLDYKRKKWAGGRGYLVNSL
jgi:hypothetical protein